jgi:hypothetical protein
MRPCCCKNGHTYSNKLEQCYIGLSLRPSGSLAIASCRLHQRSLHRNNLYLHYPTASDIHTLNLVLECPNCAIMISPTVTYLTGILYNRASARGLPVSLPVFEEGRTRFLTARAGSGRENR